MNKTKYFFKIAFTSVVLTLVLHSPMMYAQNELSKITLENHSDDSLFAKVIGTTSRTVKLSKGQNSTVNVKAGQYHILMRYGNHLDQYRYAKGDTFTVKHDLSKFSSIIIRLNKEPWIEVSMSRKLSSSQFINLVVRSEHYSILPISDKEFENANHIFAGPEKTLFNIIKIGGQVWMAENLNVSTFRNGDLIPEVKSSEEWEKAGAEGKPAWCYYENNPKNGIEYGKLYNWHAVNDPRGLAPQGWHIPSYNEIDMLLTECDDRTKFNNVIHGLSSSGFRILVGGWRHSYGDFEGLGDIASYWSSSRSTWHWNIGSRRPDAYVNDFDEGLGLSVRCLKD